LRKTGQVRIIAGKWKRRTLQFPDREDLRPSADAIRETVFNWLTPYLKDSRCLDLFAGSGAFGFEAISRGAHRAVLIEYDRETVTHLQQNAANLDKKNQLRIHCQNASLYLDSCAKPFDIIFLDPPFKWNNYDELFNEVMKSECLQDETWIYIESPKSKTPLPIPKTWHIIRESSRGMVQSTLAISRELVDE